MRDFREVVLKWLWPAGLVASGMVGVHLLVDSQGQSILGAILLGQAIILLWFIGKRSKPPEYRQSLFQRLPPFARFILLSVATGLLITGAVLATAVEPGANHSRYELAMLLWVAGLLLIVRL